MTCHQKTRYKDKQLQVQFIARIVPLNRPELSHGIRTDEYLKFIMVMLENYAEEINLLPPILKKHC
jgi:hypothetical protein